MTRTDADPYAQADARVYGASAAVLSGVLAVAAHAAAHGGTPAAAQWVMLLAACAGIGWVALCSGADTERRRRRGRCSDRRPTTLGVLAGAGVLGHLGLSLGDGHHLIPSATMLAWHLAAVLAAGLLLAAATEIRARLFSRVIAILRPVAAPVQLRAAISTTADTCVGRGDLLSAAGVRGPPVLI